MNLYVSNLGEQVTEESLRAVFAAHGRIDAFHFMKDQDTGRGFGLVDMPNDTEARRALKKIHGTVINGRSISVELTTLSALQKGNFIA